MHEFAFSSKDEDGPPVSSHSARDKLPLTVAVLAKDEEDMIGNCLASASFADEIIVINGNSRDRTVQIARDLGAVVFVRPEQQDYSALRNFALEHAKNDYVLMLDADERLTEQLRDEIQTAVTAGQCAAYLIERINIAFGKPLRVFGKDLQIKLLKKDLCRYHGLIHEKPSINGSLGQLRGVVLHYPYEDWSEYWSKLRRYTRLDPVVSSGFPEPLVRAMRTFFSYYVVHRGFLDGIVGFKLSVMSGFYELARRRETHEHRRSRRPQPL
jgi:glycosyltransferase involved in cell wall biosynthesis